MKHDPWRVLKLRKLSGGPFLLAPILLLALLAALLFWQVRHLISVSCWVDRADEVIAQSYRVERQVLALEANFRGYVIDGNPSFLRKYHDEQSRLSREIRLFLRLTSDSPGQRQAMTRAREELRRWQRYGQSVLGSRRLGRSPVPSVAPSSKADLGTEIIDRVQLQIEAIIAREDTLRKQRVLAERDTTSTLSIVVIVLVILFSLIIAQGIFLRWRWELSLRQSEELFRSLVQGVKDYGIFMLDPQGRIRSWSPGAEQTHGYRDGDILGRHIAIFYPREDRQSGKPQHDLEAARKEGRYEDADWRVKKSGSRFWADATLTALYGDNRSLKGFIMVTRDLTERKKSEDQLRQWKHLFENANWGMAVGDPQARKLGLMNPYFARMHGYGVEELQGRPIETIVAPEARPRIPLHLQTANERSNYSFESVHLRRDGSTFPALVDISTMKGEHGKVLYRAVNIKDITEQKKNQLRQDFLSNASKILSQSINFHETLERVIRLLVPTLGDWCMVDLLSDDGALRRGLILHADPAKQPLADEMTLKFSPSAELQSGFEQARTGQAVLMTQITEEWLTARLVDPERIRSILRLGIRSYMLVPLQAPNRVYGALTIVSAKRDYMQDDLSFAAEIADRAALAVHNAQLYESAQRAIRAREETLAIVSHDLKNPINAIELSGSLMLSQVLPRALLDAASRDKLEKIALNIRRSTDHATHLIHDLLDLARIEAGNLAIETAPVSVGALIDETVALLKPIAIDRSIRMDCEIKVPNCFVSCDRPRIIQVLSNLISNAIKFSPPGRCVRVGVPSCSGSEAVFSVRDEGPGIPERAISHIFDRYWQPPESRRQGTGLGLSIAKGIIDAHQGRIWVESKPGGGSIFYFTLPLARPSLGAVRASESA